MLCNAGTTVRLPEESDGLHDQDPQLEGHILVADQGYKRPQLQHNISNYMTGWVWHELQDDMLPQAAML